MMIKWHELIHTFHLCVRQPPDGVGVRHEPGELSEWSCSPAQADGSWPGDPPAGGCHLGRLL